MVDIIHRIGIKAPIKNVYQALASVEGVAGWWTKDTTGDAQVGGKVKVQFFLPDGEKKGEMDFEITKLNPTKDVHWRFTTGPAEWIGTEVVFHLYEEGDFTLVRFGHKNWREAVEFTEHCSMKWAVFLMSLREFVETGKGKPSPGDIKIDNWN